MKTNYCHNKHRPGPRHVCCRVAVGRAWPVGHPQHLLPRRAAPQGGHGFVVGGARLLLGASWCLIEIPPRRAWPAAPRRVSSPAAATAADDQPFYSRPAAAAAAATPIFQPAPPRPQPGQASRSLPTASLRTARHPPGTHQASQAPPGPGPPVTTRRLGRQQQRLLVKRLNSPTPRARLPPALLPAGWNKQAGDGGSRGHGDPVKGLS